MLNDRTRRCDRFLMNNSSFYRSHGQFSRHVRVRINHNGIRIRFSTYGTERVSEQTLSSGSVILRLKANSEEKRQFYRLLKFGLFVIND